MASELQEFEEAIARGEASLASGDLVAATIHFERALTVGEGAWGTRDPRLICPLRSLAKVAHQESWDAPASLNRQIKLFERALAISDSIVGEERTMRRDLLSTLGTLLHAAGTLDDAADHLRQAAELVPTDAGGDRRFVVGALCDVLIEAQRFDEGLPMAEELLSLAESPDAHASSRLEAWFHMGRCLIGVGRPHDAVPYFERCVAYRPKHQEFRQWVERAARAAGQAPSP